MEKSLPVKVADGLGKPLTNLLNLLPFNGEKAKLALWVAALAALQAYTGYDFGVGISPEVSLPVSLAAAAAFILHRFLKKRYGMDAWGDAIK